MKKNLFMLLILGLALSLSAGAKGDSWELYSETVGDFRAYVTSFLNEDTGLVGGHLAELQQTFDAGETWQRSFEPIEQGIRFDMDYIDENHCYSSATDGLDYSMDGARTWTRVSEELFYDISFSDVQTGWCQTDSQWFRTNDGFQSHEVLDIPEELGEVHSIAVLSYDHVKAWNSQGILYTTLDGGQSWTSIDSGAFLKSKGYNPRFAAVSMAFDTADHGVMIILNRSLPQLWLVCETQDAGESWSIFEIERDGVGRPKVSRDLNVVSLMENSDVSPEIFLYRRIVD